MKRYVTKEFFYSLESLIDYLKDQKVGEIVIYEEAKTSSFGDKMNYIASIKYAGCHGYEEALYVDCITETEKKDLFAKLQILSDEKAQLQNKSQQEELRA